MPANEIESILAIDIGSVNTRAVLFDVVGNAYRMLAAGIAHSTHLAPIKDVREGVAEAIHQIEEITGRNLLDTEHQLIIPSSFAGSGVDRLAITSSAGPDIRVAIMGLLEEFSLATTEKLANSMYTRVVERFSLEDTRKPEDRLNDFIKSEPDLVLFAGGTNQGAARALIRLMEQLRLAIQACQPEKRPVLFYAGNEVLAERFKETLEKYSSVHTASNISPFPGVEDLAPAEDALSKIFNEIRSEKLNGFRELERSSGTPILPSVTAEGRMVRFQSMQVDEVKTVLGLNVGSASSHLLLGNNARLETRVFRGLGVGEAAAETLTRVGLDAVMRWLPMEITSDVVRDYLWQKSLFPSGLPMDVESLAIEQAAARMIISEMKRACRGALFHSGSVFEPILASGAVIAQAPTSQQTALMVLDGIQPGGAATILSDRFGVLSSLGGAAEIEPAMVVHVLESGALVNLATVISPVFRAREGEIVLRVKLQEEDGLESDFEISQGEIVRLPLSSGKTAKIKIKPQKQMESFPGIKRPTSGFQVVGGELGVIIDTRGRPIRLPSDPGLRRDKQTGWYQSLQEVLH
jgi:hypothetical protein